MRPTEIIARDEREGKPRVRAFWGDDTVDWSDDERAAFCLGLAAGLAAKYAEPAPLDEDC